MERWTNSIKLSSSCHYLNFIRMATRRGKLKLCLHSLTVSCCLFWRDNSTADVDFLLLFIIPFIQSRDLSRRLPLTSTSSKQRREHFFQSAKVIAIKKNWKTGFRSFSSFELLLLPLLHGPESFFMRNDIVFVRWWCTLLLLDDGK